MARYTNTTTGVVVDVRDDKDMGSEWEPETKGKAAKPATKK